MRRLSLALVPLVALSLAGCSGGNPAPSGSASESPVPIPTTGVYAPVNGDLDAVFDLLAQPINYSSLEHSPVEGAWSSPLSEAGFAFLADAGFTAIRLPVALSTHQQQTPPYTIDEAYLERLDWAIDQALSHGMAIIIDNVNWGVEGRDDWNLIYTDPESQRARFEALWQQVGARYADQPAGVLFEIQNEPNGALDEYWNEFLAYGLDTIRETNPDRAVVVTSVHWASPWALADLVLPDDDNLIVTFHDYIPFDFTIQGATWITPQPPAGIVWPEPTVRISSAWEHWPFNTTQAFTDAGWEFTGNAEWGGVALHAISAVPGATSFSLTTAAPAELWVDCRTDQNTPSNYIPISTAAGVPYVITTSSCGLVDDNLQNIVITTGPNAGTSFTLTSISIATESGPWELFMTAQEELVEPLDFAVEWSASHGDVPLLMGEFGAWEMGDQASRERWVRAVAEAASDRGIPAAYWEFNGTWGFWTPEGITKPWLLDAILGR